MGLDDLQFIETSAKTGVNVKQLFKNLATSLPGITSSSAASASGSMQPNSAAMREGGSQLGNERFKLSANGGQMSQRQRTSQMSQDEKGKGCCGA